MYRCGLVRAGAEEAVVLARIHANRGGGDGASPAPAGAAADGHAHAHGGSGADGAPAAAAGHCHGTDPHSTGPSASGGGSDLFDRAEEIATFSAVSDAGLGPQLLMLFRNGRLEEFLVE